jgi:hypothetical protein
MVDAVLWFVTLDLAVKRVNREIGLTIGAKSIAASLLAA